MTLTARLAAEKSDLDQRLQRLCAFITDDPEWQSLPDREKELLGRQKGLMEEYSNVLEVRLAACGA